MSERQYIPLQEVFHELAVVVALNALGEKWTNLIKPRPDIIRKIVDCLRDDRRRHDDYQFQMRAYRSSLIADPDYEIGPGLDSGPEYPLSRAIVEKPAKPSSNYPEFLRDILSLLVRQGIPIGKCENTVSELIATTQLRSYALNDEGIPRELGQGEFDLENLLSVYSDRRIHLHIDDIAIFRAHGHRPPKRATYTHDPSPPAEDKIDLDEAYRLRDATSRLKIGRRPTIDEDDDWRRKVSLDRESMRKLRQDFQAEGESKGGAPRKKITRR